MADVDNKPGFRYELVSAPSLPDLVHQINARIALGWRTLHGDPMPDLGMTDNTWMALIRFDRPQSTELLEAMIPEISRGFHAALADLRTAIEAGSSGDARIAADRLGARGANMIDLLTLRG